MLLRTDFIESAVTRRFCCYTQSIYCTNFSSSEAVSIGSSGTILALPGTVEHLPVPEFLSRVCADKLSRRVRDTCNTMGQTHFK